MSVDDRFGGHSFLKGVLYVAALMLNDILRYVFLGRHVNNRFLIYVIFIKYSHMLC